MRLDKYLSQHLGLSRSIVGHAIRTGAVMVDGVIMTQRGATLTLAQRVHFHGEPVVAQGYRYFMLHKPAGYVCSTDDARHLTVLSLLDEPNKHGLHSAGRLDSDTTGLVLLTDDGQWSHRITSPRSKCDKVYVVKLHAPLSVDVITQFQRGIQLHREKYLTKPANLVLIDAFHARVTLSEGRYHQVKRMFAAVGNHVIALHREQIGCLKLTIAEGEYRALTDREIKEMVNG